MELYKYTPLSAAKNIRLLRLHPGIPGSALKCELREVGLDEYEYEAVSYCWGDSSLVSHIECDDKKIPITKSCAEVLQRFQLKKKHRILWIDGICIDQSSKREVEQQVQLMGELYEGAFRTLIWLGRGTKTTDVICKHLKKIGPLNPEGEDNPSALPPLKRFWFSLYNRQLLRDHGKC